MSKMAEERVQVKLELGHKAQHRKHNTPEGFTHDWVIFVRGPDGGNISHFIEKVVFHLHESFHKPKRVVKVPPYSVGESGYAGFTMLVDIYFRNEDDPKKIQFDYDLFLPADGCAPVSNLRCEKLTFQNPTADFKKKLIKSGGVLLVNGQKVETPKYSDDDESDIHDDDNSDDCSEPEHPRKPKITDLTVEKKKPSKQSVVPPEPKPQTKVEPKNDEFTSLFGTPLKVDRSKKSPKDKTKKESLNQKQVSSQKDVKTSSKDKLSKDGVSNKRPATDSPSDVETVKKRKKEDKSDDRKKDKKIIKDKDRSSVDREKSYGSKPQKQASPESLNLSSSQSSSSSKNRDKLNSSKSKSESKSKEKASKDDGSIRKKDDDGSKKKLKDELDGSSKKREEAGGSSKKHKDDEAGSSKKKLKDADVVSKKKQKDSGRSKIKDGEASSKKKDDTKIKSKEKDKKKESPEKSGKNPIKVEKEKESFSSKREEKVKMEKKKSSPEKKDKMTDSPDEKGKKDKKSSKDKDKKDKKKDSGSEKSSSSKKDKSSEKSSSSKNSDSKEKISKSEKTPEKTSSKISVETKIETESKPDTKVETKTVSPQKLVTIPSKPRSWKLAEDLYSTGSHSDSDFSSDLESKSPKLNRSFSSIPVKPVGTPRKDDKGQRSNSALKSLFNEIGDDDSDDDDDVIDQVLSPLSSNKSPVASSVKSLKSTPDVKKCDISPRESVNSTPDIKSPDVKTSPDKREPSPVRSPPHPVPVAQTPPVVKSENQSPEKTFVEDSPRKSHKKKKNKDKDREKDSGKKDKKKHKKDKHREKDKKDVGLSSSAKRSSKSKERKRKQSESVTDGDKKSEINNLYCSPALKPEVETESQRVESPVSFVSPTPEIKTLISPLKDDIIDDVVIDDDRSVFTDEYLLELVILQHKLTKLNNSDVAQRVADLVNEAKCFSVGEKTLDFDLCDLDKNTVKLLQSCLQDIPVG